LNRFQEKRGCRILTFCKAGKRNPLKTRTFEDINRSLSRWGKMNIFAFLNNSQNSRSPFSTEGGQYLLVVQM
jgi:hypothetical protein